MEKTLLQPFQLAKTRPLLPPPNISISDFNLKGFWYMRNTKSRHSRDNYAPTPPGSARPESEPALRILCTDSTFAPKHHWGWKPDGVPSKPIDEATFQLGIPPSKIEIKRKRKTVHVASTSQPFNSTNGLRTQVLEELWSTCQQLHLHFASDIA